MPANQPSASDEKIYIGLGANLGDRRSQLERAVAYIGESSDIIRVATSAFRETPPWGVTDQPPFLNGVVEIRTAMSPDALLRFLKDGERKLGRTPTARWGPRIIDMDILLFGSRIIKTPHLQIPHAEMTNRRFVLEPLLELNPALCHPATQVPLRDYLQRLP